MVKLIRTAEMIPIPRSQKYISFENVCFENMYAKQSKYILLHHSVMHFSYNEISRYGPKMCITFQNDSLWYMQRSAKLK